MPDSSIASQTDEKSSVAIRIAGLIKDERLRAGADYWASLRQGRRAPRRRDVDPTEIPSGLLPWIVLADREGDDFRIRLAGTGQYSLIGRDVTGRTLSALTDNAEYNAYISGIYRRAASEMRPIYSETEFRIGGSIRQLGRLVTPLSDDGETASQMLSFQVELRLGESRNADIPFFAQDDTLSYSALLETPLDL